MNRLRCFDLNSQLLIFLMTSALLAETSSIPWSFLSDSESYLKINGTTNIGRLLKFRFKSYDYKARLVRAKLGPNWLSLTLDDGFVSVLIGPKKVVIPRLDSIKVNDMKWHDVKLITDSTGGVTFWIDRIVFYLPLSHKWKEPGSYVWDNIWFGTPKEDLKDTNEVQNSFIGCLHLMKPHSPSSDDSVNNAVDKSRFVVSGCLDACVVQTCAHGGKCINRVNHAVCDCMGTGFEGPTCEQESPVIYMDGSSFIAFDTAENPYANQEEFISMRVRTSQESALLMTTSFSKDHIIIEITKGRVEVSLDFGGGNIKFESGTVVNDGKWHYIKLVRHYRVVSLYIDNGFVSSTTLNSVLLQLQMSGGEELVYFGGSKSKPINSLVRNKANFTGCLQQVRFNRIDIVHSLLYVEDWRLSFYGDRSKTCKKLT